MNGRVYAINRPQRRAAIETEVHGFTIVELPDGDDVEVGDEIAWDGDLKTGEETYRNVTTQRTLHVIVRGHLVSRSGVRQQLFA